MPRNSVTEDTPLGPKIIVKDGFAYCRVCHKVNRCYCRPFYLIGHSVKCDCGEDLEQARKEATDDPAA